MSHASDTITNLKRVGGALALDFANTAEHEQAVIIADWMLTYSDLLAWSEHTGVLTPELADHLRGQALWKPDEVAVVVEGARALREIIYHLFAALAEGASPHESDLAALNSALTHCQRWLHVVPAEHGCAWGWVGDADALDRPLWALARAAADLLVSPDVRRVRQCAGDRCGWLFVDTSRNRSRRWCDMEDCGNRAKARRHYARSSGRAPG